MRRCSESIALSALLALSACAGPEEKPPGETGPVEEPDPYIVSEGLPASSGEWDGQLEYGYVHPYSWGDGAPLLGVERITAFAGFFPPSTAGTFDVAAEDLGCWTDPWEPGWTERLDVGDSLEAQIGAEPITMSPSNASDGVIYTWRADDPPPDWATAPGSTLTLDGVDTGVPIPEPLEMKALADAWVAYDGAEDGTLALEWEPPTVEGTWIQVIRREETGGYTRCHVWDDGAVTIRFGTRRYRDDPRLVIARVSSGEAELPTYGRVFVYAEDQVLLDP